MIIRINDEQGNNMGECKISQHDIGIWDIEKQSNIKNISFNIEEEYFDYGTEYDDVININILSKKIQMSKSLAIAWKIFEAIRTNCDLDIADDYSYASEIILVPYTYNFITDEEADEYHNILSNFLGWNGVFFECDEDYTYEDLDNLILNLNEIYKEQ